MENYDRLIRETCPICNNKDATFVCDRQGQIVEEKFSVVQCSECDFLYIQNPIHEKYLNEIYTEDYFNGEGLDPGAGYDSFLKKQPYFYDKFDFQLGNELAQYNINDNAKWLDIGCAFGNVLDWVKFRYQADTHGVEISKHAANFTQERGHKILSNLIKDVPNEYNGTFDVITCYEVMEHLYHPNEFMANVQRLLKTGGVFHYSTCKPPKLDKIKSWSYINNPEVHISFYSPKCIRYLFSKHNIGISQRKRKFVYKPKIFKLSFRRKIRELIPQGIIDRFDPLQPDGIKH